MSEWYVAEHTPVDEDPDDVLLTELIRIYYEEHGQHVRSHETIRLNLTTWLDYFPEDATVSSAAKPASIDKFVKHLKAEGKGASYINRILTTGRAAINRAWKTDLIKSAPFIRSLETEEADPKGCPMDMNELRLFYHSSETPHLKSFVLWALGTAARPEAVLDLHSNFIDLKHGLVTLNPPQRKQTKKYRPTVKLPDSLQPFIVEGYQVSYRGKPCSGIKTAWRNHRQRCGFDGQINPYSLRHTIARHLRASGVAAWEVAAQLGHKRKDLSTTEIYAPFDPSYLSEAVAAIDLFLQELLISPDERPLISSSSRVPSEDKDLAQGLDFIGAGDEIRTHDPNLGKVVLYP
ncbi:MAG: tyrosine-type recombinase/integrase [Myxococcota bacterium]